MTREELGGSRFGPNSKLRPSVRGFAIHVPEDDG